MRKRFPAEYRCFRHRCFRLKRGPGRRIEARGCNWGGTRLTIGGGNLRAVKEVIDSQLDVRLTAAEIREANRYASRRPR